MAFDTPKGKSVFAHGDPARACRPEPLARLTRIRRNRLLHRRGVGRFAAALAGFERAAIPRLLPAAFLAFSAAGRPGAAVLLDATGEWVLTVVREAAPRGHALAPF